MPSYDRGYRRRGGYWNGDWSDPWGDVTGSPYDRRFASERPWVGGYRPGYQGGSGGISTGGARTPAYGRDYAPRYGRDYWWLGEHELERQGRLSDYDRAYRDFDRQSHPRFSPVGGTYAAMGGAYAYHRPPRPLREDTWFSEWTRWF